MQTSLHWVLHVGLQKPTIPIFCFLNGFHTQTTKTRIYPFLYCQKNNYFELKIFLHLCKHNNAKLNINTQPLTHVAYIFFPKQKKSYKCPASWCIIPKSIPDVVFVCVYVCLCVCASVLYVFTDICSPQVKGVKTSGSTLTDDRWRSISVCIWRRVYESLYYGIHSSGLNC